MNFDRITISLEDFVQYLLKKWKVIVAIVGVCVVLFAGTAKMLGGEISVPHSEEYLYYERDLAWHESYLENSVLMNLDPTCIYQRAIILRNISDVEVLHNYVTSSGIWEEFDTEWSKLYFTELVKWEATEEGNSIRVVMNHATSEECLDAVQYLEEKIKVKDPQVETIIGEEKVVVNEKLQEEHLRWYSRLDYVNTLLLESQAGFTLKVSFVAAGITGAFAGGIFSVFMLLALYITKGKSGK